MGQEVVVPEKSVKGNINNVTFHRANQRSKKSSRQKQTCS